MGRWVLTAWVVVCCLLDVPGATAQPVDRPAPWANGVTEDQRARALELFREGNDLYGESEYADAATRYRSALDVWDHPRIHGNLATALIHLDDLVDAVGHIDLALAYGAQPFDEHVYEHLVTNRKLLASQLSRISITCEMPGATVSIDGSPVLTGPSSAEVVVRAGPHEIVGKKGGHLTVSSSITAIGGQDEKVVIVLVPLTDAKLYERKWAAWKPWAVVGAGAALTLSAIPMGMASVSARDQFESELAAECARGCEPSDIPDSITAHEDRARLWNRLEIAAYAVGGVTLATGFVLAYLNREMEVELTESGTRVSALPIVSPSHVGVVLELGF
jgi:hypothetical protein